MVVETGGCVRFGRKRAFVAVLAFCLWAAGCASDPMSGVQFACDPPGGQSTCLSGWVCVAESGHASYNGVCKLVGDAEVVADPGPGDPGPLDPGVDDSAGGDPAGETDLAEPGADLAEPAQDTVEAIPDVSEPLPDAADTGPDPADVCVAQCAGRQCGDDGCGGTCGSCDGGKVCQSGQCVGCPVDWVTIPGGTYQMGSEDWAKAKPVHPVAVSGFKMGRTEVTVCQYLACVTDGTCTPPGSACTQGADDQPVVCVDWNQSKAYCAWAGGRLCSEAEWEYAARNGSAGNLYPWGDPAPTCDDAVYHDCGSPSSPSSACSKPAGNDTWGVCDLAGNVWEWVEDDWHDSYDVNGDGYQSGGDGGMDGPSDGSAWVDSPRGSYRVLRGGSFGLLAAALRASFRFAGYPSDAGAYYGARCCRSP